MGIIPTVEASLLADDNRGSKMDSLRQIFRLFSKLGSLRILDVLQTGWRRNCSLEVERKNNFQTGNSEEMDDGPQERDVEFAHRLKRER